MSVIYFVSPVPERSIKICRFLNQHTMFLNITRKYKQTEIKDKTDHATAENKRQMTPERSELQSRECNL